MACGLARGWVDPRQSRAGASCSLPCIDRRDSFHERRLPRKRRSSAHVQPRRRPALRPRSRLSAAALPRRCRHRRTAHDPHPPEPTHRPPPAPTPLAARPPRARPARSRPRRDPRRLPAQSSRQPAPRLCRHANRRCQSRPPHTRHRRRRLFARPIRARVRAALADRADDGRRPASRGPAGQHSRRPARRAVGGPVPRDR